MSAVQQGAIAECGGGCAVWILRPVEEQAEVAVVSVVVLLGHVVRVAHF